MATLTDTDINDLVIGTLKDLGKLRFNMVATTIQQHEVMGRLMKKDKVQFESGRQILRRLQVTTAGNARMVGLWEADSASEKDTLKEISIPWRHTTGNYSYDRKELAMNRAGPTQIVDIVEPRRVGCMVDIANLMETQFFGKPTDSTDNKSVWGVFYWLGWTSGTTGHSSVHAIGSDTAGLSHARWANYMDTYTDVTKDDLILKARKAYRKIRFKSPTPVSDHSMGSGDFMYRIYTNDTVANALEEIGEAQNENLGRELAPYTDQMVFRGHEIQWVPELDGNATRTDPFIMLNLNDFRPVFLKGEYLRESEPRPSATQHTVSTIHVDLTWQVLCVNRRSQALLATA